MDGTSSRSSSCSRNTKCCLDMQMLTPFPSWHKEGREALDNRFAGLLAMPPSLCQMISSARTFTRRSLRDCLNHLFSQRRRIKICEIQLPIFLLIENFWPVFKYGQCRPGNCAARQLLPAPRRSPNKFAEPSHSRLRCYQFMNISTNVTNIKVLRSSRMEPGTNVFAPGLLTSLHALRRCHHLHNRDWSGQTTWLTSPPLATLSTFTRDEC